MELDEGAALCDFHNGHSVATILANFICLRGSSEKSPRIPLIEKSVAPNAAGTLYVFVCVCRVTRRVEGVGGPE